MRNDAKPRLAPARKVPLEQRGLIVLCVVLVVLQSLLIVASVFAVNAARSYVAGESAWSKAQKNATRHLLRYARSGDPAAFAAYEAEIAVAFADRRAREYVLAADPDLAAARRALIEGRNHPQDVAGMVWFLHLFRSMPEVARAIASWERADAGVAELDHLARAVRAKLEGGAVSQTELGALVRRIEDTDARLDSFAEDFSFALGQSARAVRSLVLGSATSLTTLLLGVGATLTWRLIRRARRLEAELRKFVEHSSDMFTLLDSAGRYRFASPNIERYLGWTDADRVGRSAFEFIHPDDRVRVFETLAMGLAQPDTPHHVEFRFQHKDGGYRIVEAAGTAIESEESPELVVVSRDVTETRALEQKLARAQRLESIGRLAGGLAHDFNNLLTAVIGHAEQARSNLADTALVEESLDEIVKASERSARLTRQILAFARRQKVAPRSLDLGALVLGLRSMLERALGDGITLSFEIEPELGWVRADPGQIEQVVMNLVLNARDAMPEGGHVTIEVRNEDPGSDGSQAERVMLAVTDTGCGIDPEAASHLFEPFYSTKPEGHGTGLGLATCHSIVEEAGGAIRVAAGREGLGARFEVLLPRVPREETLAAPEQQPMDAPGGRETVLVVEDEPLVRSVTVRILETKGYRVLEAKDGIDALAVLESQGDEIALVVSDMLMPRLGGAMLAERIAERWPKMRVLLVSGYANEATSARQTGRVDLLHKPFTRETLVAAVRRALDA